MRAAVHHVPGDVRVEEVTRPDFHEDSRPRRRARGVRRDEREAVKVLVEVDA